MRYLKMYGRSIKNRMRIFINAKAKFNIGEFLRSAKSRDIKAKKAEDHDMNPIAKLVRNEN